MNNPEKDHWNKIKWILMYLRVLVVMEVQKILYKDTLMQIWQVIKIAGGAPHCMFLLQVEQQ